MTTITTKYKIICFGDFNSRAKITKWARNCALPRPVYTSVIAHKLTNNVFFVFLYPTGKRVLRTKEDAMIKSAEILGYKMNRQMMADISTIAQYDLFDDAFDENFNIWYGIPFKLP